MWLDGEAVCAPQRPSVCHERCCVEVHRQACAANQLRALVARMVEFVPTDHPLVAEAWEVLD